ncbi:putative tetratricopeptide repeat protein 15 [Golovinomyces cichoracearum]|uniref:Putative tetratricopeptide repeat protein 15 n=1 Tax=Golovinomyces cichoracearum TaxID=62708 RepID=A0A420IM25_9PEZI|nr:putative tetratricopeptide repeat protein 15 [Golovinomyces cichoracearum]
MDKVKKNEGQDGQSLSGKALGQRSIRGQNDVSKDLEIKSKTKPLLSPISSSKNAHAQTSIPGLSYSLKATSPIHYSKTSKYNTPKDFSALLSPNLYHPLSNSEIPPPLRNLATQPDATVSVAELIKAGFFREAAIKAAEILTKTGHEISINQIFDLVYKRLACLTLCHQITIAVQEVKALEDLNSTHYRDEKSGQHIVPWELRVLAVRLQGIGFGDVRKSVIGYYDLVSDVRLNLKNLRKERRLLISSNDPIEKTQTEINLWEKRLSDLGLRVASALIEMEDFEGASRFLSTLRPSPFNPNLNHQKALLWLCLGDVEAALNCAQDDKVLIILAHIADKQFEKAVQGWEDLIKTGNPDEVAMWKQNLAVSLIYLGRIEEARKILEILIDEDGYGFHALTFNLSTIYELTTERSRCLKIGLAEKLAEILETSKAQGLGKIKIGWDKVNGDFKL